MAIKHTDIFHPKALQNIPKLGFFWFENIPSGKAVHYTLAVQLKLQVTALHSTKSKKHTQMGVEPRSSVSESDAMSITP
jgi:hypothetical protein